MVRFRIGLTLLCLVGAGLLCLGLFWPEHLRAVSRLDIRQERVAPCPGEPAALPLAYAQDLRRLGQLSIPERRSDAGFHLRQGPKRHTLRLEVEAPPGVDVAGLATAWGSAFRRTLNKERRALLEGRPVSERECLEARLLRVESGGPPSPPEAVAVPWAASAATLILLACLAVGVTQHNG